MTFADLLVNCSQLLFERSRVRVKFLNKRDSLTWSAASQSFLARRGPCS